MQILFAAAHFLNAFINLFSFIRTRARKNKRENLFDDITEGFITDQKSLGNRFGIKRLFYNGCGIVALYNILSFLKVKIKQ